MLVVPRTSAENTGLDDTDIIAKLYKAHSEQDENADQKDNEDERLSVEKLKDIRSGSQCIDTTPTSLTHSYALVESLLIYAVNYTNFSLLLFSP